MYPVPVGLYGNTRKQALFSHQLSINLVHLPGKGMYDHRMAVGIVIMEKTGHGLPLCIGLGILLAQIPVQGQVMAKAGNQLTVIKLTLDPHLTSIQELVILGFLCLEMKEHPQRVGMTEDHLPLVESGTVKMGQVGAVYIGKNVLVVPSDIHGEEGKGIQPLRRQVIDSSYDPLAPVTLPHGITGIPVPDVPRPGLDQAVSLAIGFKIPVKTFVGQEIFGSIRPSLQEIFSALLILQEMFPHIIKAACSPVIPSRFVRRKNFESAACAVKWGQSHPVRSCFDHGQVPAQRKGGQPGPGPGGIGRKMHPPDVPRIRTAFPGNAIGCKVAGDHIGPGTIGESHLKVIIQERIGIIVNFPVSRSVKGKGDPVPLFELPAQGHFSRTGVRWGNQGIVGFHHHKIHFQ